MQLCHVKVQAGFFKDANLCGCSIILDDAQQTYSKLTKGVGFSQRIKGTPVKILQIAIWESDSTAFARQELLNTDRLSFHRSVWGQRDI